MSSLSRLISHDREVFAKYGLIPHGDNPGADFYLSGISLTPRDFNLSVVVLHVNLARLGMYLKDLWLTLNIRGVCPSTRSDIPGHVLFDST